MRARIDESIRTYALVDTREMISAIFRDAFRNLRENACKAAG